MDFEQRIEHLHKETIRLNNLLNSHKQIIVKHEVKITSLKKFNKFANTGTFVSIVLSILATLLGYESISFASNVITLVCLALMIIDLFILSYHHRSIGKQYGYMTDAMRSSMQKEIEWVKSQMIS